MSERYRIVREPPYIVVQVDDYELSDWIEDVLTEEHDVEVEYLLDKADGTRKLAILDSVPLARIQSILNGLDPEEVERIWRANNP